MWMLEEDVYVGGALRKWNYEKVRSPQKNMKALDMYCLRTCKEK